MQHALAHAPSRETSSPVSLSLQTEQERGGDSGEWEGVKGVRERKRGQGKKSSAGGIRTHTFLQCPARGKGGQGVGGGEEDFFAQKVHTLGICLEFCNPRSSFHLVPAVKQQFTAFILVPAVIHNTLNKLVSRCS